jgi:hypothetical protein
LSATGSSCKSTAIAGKAVAKTVPSRFSMNNAVATMSGVSNEKEDKARRFRRERRAAGITEARRLGQAGEPGLKPMNGENAMSKTADADAAEATGRLAIWWTVTVKLGTCPLRLQRHIIALQSALPRRMPG